MIRFGRNLRIVFSALLCAGAFVCLPAHAAANTGIETCVEVIKADQKSTFVDPKLKKLVKEIGSVLNYSGFRLIRETRVHLDRDEEGEIILPSGRLLKLHFQGFEDKRARLVVKILENEKEIFSATLLLANEGKALIGGPPYESGVLLLRIGAIF